MTKILIIEDDISIAEIEKDYLELNGYVVTVEKDGLSGLKTALAENFNLILLDIMLPGMEGFEVCKKIREEKNVPIIMVSARQEEIDKIKGLGCGADDYITKPFSPNELVARVKAHISMIERLSEDGHKTHEVIEIRGMKIDKTSRRVFIDEVEKNLTKKEFDLLSFLAESPDKVYSKEELFNKIWEMESYSDGDIATVTVHIKKIREKIEKDPANPEYIATKWGVGYYFRVETED